MEATGLFTAALGLHSPWAVAACGCRTASAWC